MAFYMVRRAAVFAGGVLAVATAGSAHAALVDLTDYNAFVIGSYNGHNSDVQGRLAAGGAVSLVHYGVATGLDASANGTDSLIVGGSLTATDGQLHYGNAVIGGASSLTRFSTPNGTVTGGSPIDFAEQATLLGSLADSLGAMAANGTTTKEWGGIKLLGTDAGLNVFTVQASDLRGANDFVITAPEGSQVLVNVVGGSASLQNMGFSVKGAAASDVLLNFYQAGSLNLGGIGIQGSILAPDASVNFNNGQLNGLLIAANYNGGGQLHDTGYTGDLLTVPSGPVPEPATWAMLIAGFGLVGTALRRARRTGVAVIA